MIHGEQIFAFALQACLALTVLALIFAMAYAPIIDACGVMR